MPFAKVLIEATITTNAIPTKGRKQVDGNWVDGPTRFAYGYQHVHNDGILAGQLTCDNKDLHPGQIVRAPLRVELKNQNIQQPEGEKLEVVGPGK